MTAEDVVVRLERAAKEIASQSLNGWGNTCTDGAEEIKKLREALGELHAMVWGECRSLLDEDSGGCSRLDMEIRDLIEAKA